MNASRSTGIYQAKLFPTERNHGSYSSKLRFHVIGNKTHRDVIAVTYRRYTLNDSNVLAVTYRRFACNVRYTQLKGFLKDIENTKKQATKVAKMFL